MKTLRLAGRLFIFLAFLASLAGLFACGGGGGGGSTPPPPPPAKTHTITITLVTGVHTPSTSLTVNDGGSITIPFTLDAGYTNLVVSGGNGTLSGLNYTLTNVTANVTLNASATAPIVTHTITITLGAGVHTPATSLTVNDGGSVTIPFTLDAGYTNLVVSGGNGALSGLNYTLTNVTANVTLNASATAPVLTHTVTITLGTGVHTPSTSLTVNDGGSITIPFTLDAGYTNLVVQGGNGTLSGLNYTLTNVTAPVALYATATAPIVTHTVTITLGPGVHTPSTSLAVDDGWNVTIPFTLDAGYANLVVTGGNGTLSALDYTLTNVTTNIALTATATAVAVTDIPATRGKIVFVVAPDVLTDMTPLINQFMSAVTVDTNCDSILLSSPSTPTEIRNYLQGIGTDLRMAFFIGNVPMIYHNNGGIIQLSDHYYRALRYPYGSVYTDANGRYVVDVPTDSGRYYSWRPTNLVARIIGLTASTQLTDIRAFLEKDLLMRDNLTGYVRGTTLVNATSDIVIDGAAVLNEYVQHPLFAQSEVNFVPDTTAQATKDAFFTSLYRGEEISQILIHGAPTAIGFRGQTAGDEILVNSDTFKDPQIHAKYISLDSCSTGNFATDNFLAGNALMGNAYTLLVTANTVETFLSDQFFDQQARTRNFVLGAGRSLMTSYPYAFPGEPSHCFGDPTVKFRAVDLSQPHPQMVFAAKRYHQEFSDNFVFNTDSQGETLYQDLIIDNKGTSDLVIKTTWRAIDSATVDGQIGSFFNGNGFFFPDYAFTEGGTFNCTITVPSGTSKVIKVAFEPYQGTTSGNGQKLAGQYQSSMTLFSNDPEIGSFEIVFQANVK